MSDPKWSKGDRVQHTTKGAGPGQRITLRGTVSKHVRAVQNNHAVLVVDWDNGTRTTVWDDSVVPEEK